VAEVLQWLRKIIRRAGRSASIGFSAKVLAPEDRTGEIFREVEPEDLFEIMSLSAEFVGRLPFVATLEDPDEPRSSLFSPKPITRW